MTAASLPIVDRLLSPFRNVVINSPQNPVTFEYFPPATPRIHQHDLREELDRLEKATKRLLQLLEVLDRPPAHIASLGPEVAAMISFQDAVNFSRAQQSVDADSQHRKHINCIEHHLKHLLSHIRAEAPGLLTKADLQDASERQTERDALENRLQKLRQEVQKWCKNAFGSTQQIKSNTSLISVERCSDTDSPKVAGAVEILFWTKVEERWFSGWFPVGIDGTTSVSLMSTEEKLRLTAGQASAEAWRSYTCELLSRCPPHTVIAEADTLFQVLDDAVKSLTSHRIPRFYRSSCSRILETTLKLSMDMKSGRSTYEVDTAVKLGDEFDQTSMETMTVGDTGGLIVTAIICRGIVGKMHRESGEQLGWVGKNRVLLRAENDADGAQV